MSTTRSIDQTDIICGLKAAVTALECRHNARKLRREKGSVGCEKTSSTVCVTIQPARVKKEKFRSKPAKCDTARVPLKDVAPLTESVRCREKKRLDRCAKTSRLIFPEMRGGVLYSKCCCLHRNGLQDHCPLSQCQGQPECLVTPWAVCPPGKFVRLRYPELYPKASETSCVPC